MLYCVSTIDLCSLPYLEVQDFLSLISLGLKRGFPWIL